MEVKEVRSKNGTVIGAVGLIDRNVAVIYTKSRGLVEDVAAAIRSDPDFTGNSSITLRKATGGVGGTKDWVNPKPEMECFWSLEDFPRKCEWVSAAGLTNEQFIQLQNMPGKTVGASCEAAAAACGANSQVFIHNSYLAQVKSLIQKQLDSAD